MQWFWKSAVTIRDVFNRSISSPLPAPALAEPQKYLISCKTQNNKSNKSRHISLGPLFILHIEELVPKILLILNFLQECQKIVIIKKINNGVRKQIYNNQESLKVLKYFSS